MILLKQAAVVWLRFPKDIVSLVSALLTLAQLLNLFRAAAETKHRRGGSLLMQANIFVRKDRLCTPEREEAMQLIKLCQYLLKTVVFQFNHASQTY